MALSLMKYQNFLQPDSVSLHAGAPKFTIGVVSWPPEQFRLRLRLLLKLVGDDTNREKNQFY